MGVSASGRAVLHTVLRPRSGRMHQLRVHLAALGAGILGDRRYPPDLLPDAPDDHSLPLQLLARELEFTDPLSGGKRGGSSPVGRSARCPPPTAERPRVVCASDT